VCFFEVLAPFYLRVRGEGGGRGKEAVGEGGRCSSGACNRCCSRRGTGAATGAGRQQQLQRQAEGAAAQGEDAAARGAPSSGRARVGAVQVQPL
jgi:hypothetical protein